MVFAQGFKPHRWFVLSWLGGLILVGGSELGLAQDLPEPSKPDRGMSLRPQRPVGFPSDPPPHEGAMIDVPIILEPPDVIVVEVLEALPGRPITGERLIRPDGKISLGFYGDLHVRGLTIEQAKVKIVLHMRRWLPDNLLGLTHFIPADEKTTPSTPGSPARPESPAPVKPDQPVPPPSQSRQTAPDFKVRVVSQKIEIDDVAEAFKILPREALPPIEDGQNVPIAPQDTDRVFVDIAAHNTRIYFVQGDVGTPGRLPFTGKETVLDAMNFAGGMIPTAEPTDIHLYRPARGDQPAHDYPINYAAILKGDAKANLQIFPDDRLVIGRNAIVKKTIDLDRAAGLMQSIFSSYKQFNTAVPSVNPNQVNTSWIALPEWFETLWTEIAVNPATLNDPERFHAVVNRLLERTMPKK